MKEDIKKYLKFYAGALGAVGVYSLFDFDNTEISAATVGEALSNVAIGAGLSGLLAAGGLVGLKYYHNKRAKQDYRYIRITPSARTHTNKEDTEQLIKALWRSFRPMWQRVLKGREYFQLIFHCDQDGQIHIYLGFPQDRYSFICKSVKTAYPLAEIGELEGLPPIDTNEGTGGNLKFSKSKYQGFPLQAFSGKDKISSVLEHLEEGTSIIVTVSPTRPKRLKKVIKATEARLYKDVGFDPKTTSKATLDIDIKEQINSLYQRARNQNPFNVKINVWNELGHDYAVQSVVNAINTVTAAQNSLRLSRLYKIVKQRPQLKPQPLLKGMLWTGSELESIFHLPNGKTAEQIKQQAKHLYDRLLHVPAGQTFIPAQELTEGVFVGRYLNPAQDNRNIFVSEATLRKMGLVVGKTGSGKSALALDMIESLIDQREQQATGGFTVIDPKGDLVKTVLTRLNKRQLEGQLKDDTIYHYFDVSGKDYAFGINPLQKRNPNKPADREESEAIINTTLDVLKTAWSGESILFERFGRLIIKALLADNQQHTILAISEFLREDSPLRERLINQLRKGNPYQKEIARELIQEEEKFKGSALEPLRNRLVKIKESSVMRRIFGQIQTTINPLEWMEQGHIVLFNVQGLTQDQMRIVMGYILAEYHKFAVKRRNTAQNHYMIIDEAHEVRDLDILSSQIIPKDRDFGLSVLLLTQSAHQFSERLYNAITELAGFYASCLSGAETAKAVNRITAGRVEAQTLQNLRPLTAIIDTERENGERITFMVESNPPIIFNRNGEPTYFGQDKERQGKEKAEAFQHSLETVGLKWMQRDCKYIEAIEAEITDYIERITEPISKPTKEEIIQKANTPNSTKRKKKSPEIKKLLVKTELKPKAKPNKISFADVPLKDVTTNDNQ